MSEILHAPLLVVGGGMASARLLLQLHERGFCAPTTLVSQESHIGYNRVLLPQLLAGSCEVDVLLDQQAPWRDAPWLDVVSGLTATDVHCDRREVVFSDGRTISYERLVLAIGGHVPALRCAIDGAPSISYLRRLEDVQQLLKRAPQSVAVIGGGLLGLEAADALSAIGVEVTVLHRGSHLLNRQLDACAASYLAQELRANGIRILLDADIVTIAGEQGANQILLSDGQSVMTQHVLAANGIAPNPIPCETLNKATNGGVEVDQFMRTSQPNVYALGECAVINGAHATMVDLVYAQANALAQTLCGEPTRASMPLSQTRLKVRRPEVFAVGDVTSTDHQVSINSPAASVYRSLFIRKDKHRGDTLSGVVLVGDTQGAKRLAGLVGECVGSDIQANRHLECLVFGSAI